VDSLFFLDDVLLVFAFSVTYDSRWYSAGLSHQGAAARLSATSLDLALGGQRGQERRRAEVILEQDLGHFLQLCQMQAQNPHFKTGT
jgi:hypothetical protein